MKKEKSPKKNKKNDGQSKYGIALKKYIEEISQKDFFIKGEHNRGF